MSEAKDTDLFSNHTLSSSDLAKLNIGWDNEIFIPFDYGYFSFIYNSSKLR